MEEELTDDGVADLDDEDTEDGVADLDEADEGATEEVVPPAQTVPLTVGLSSAPPFLFNWKPKLVDWPG